MPKYYEVNQDDFESLPFNSEFDEELSGHKIAKKYRRDECIVCPGCGEMIREEEDWNDNSDCLSPLCPFCLFEFEMETQT